MMRSRIIASLAAFLLLGPVVAGRAAADNVDEARAYVEKATAAYALNKYAAAAENFEKAFELKPDPALLYNAAQSYRLAGNKERALALYESYLRVYPKEKKRSEIEAHIKQLKTAIEHDREAANAPPFTTDPVTMGGGDSRNAHTAPPPSQVLVKPIPPAPIAPPPPAPAPVTPIASATEPPPASPSSPPPLAPPPASPAVVLTQGASDGQSKEPLTHKTWFWVAIGGGVVAATVVVILLASGGSNPASASLGRVSGN
jgi:tetratricopeptide (TPR) repeat protein